MTVCFSKKTVHLKFVGKEKKKCYFTGVEFKQVYRAKQKVSWCTKPVKILLTVNR